MPRQQDLEKELRQWQRRLQKRKEQKAKFGISADPSIDIEIEDIEARIEGLQAELAELKKQNTHVQTSPTPPPEASLPAVEVAEPNPELAGLRAKPRIFLCHASEDKDRVKELYHLLKEAGYHPWLDKFDLLPGQRWRPAIRKVITNHDNLVLVCLSQNSITKRGVVQQEIKWALDILAQMPEEAIYLIPVRLEVCQVPEQLSPLHWVNLFESDGFDYLTRALDFEIGKRRAVPTPKPKPKPSKPSQPAKPEPKPTKLPKIITPSQPFEPELILIPAGEFLMGSDPNVDKAARDNEQPQHTLHLPDYYIAKTPVTNAQYAAFVEATGHDQPHHWENDKIPKDKEDHPVVEITWQDAVAYCHWLAETTGKPYRLPTETEWEKAARGTDGRIYPWGNQWDAKRCNNGISGPKDTTPVGSYPDGASPYGVLDMAGNVWEWAATKWQKSYPYDVEEDEWREEYLAGADIRVVRGGAFDYTDDLVRAAYRFSRDYPDFRYIYLGFRIVRAPLSSES